MIKIRELVKTLTIMMVVGLSLLPAKFAFATGADTELTDREKAAFIVRDEWTSWVREFTNELNALDKNATERIYENMDYYDMQYRFTEKYKKVPEYLDEDGKPTDKLKELIRQKRKEIAGATSRDYLKFTAVENDSRLRWYFGYGGISGDDIGYSLDGTSFVPWPENTDVTVNVGESIYVRNNKNTLSRSMYEYVNFRVPNGSFDISGNINSMINFAEVTPYCFHGLFCDNTYGGGRWRDCSKLKLPSKVLAERCYDRLFSNSDIRNAPELPATTLALGCYAGMFNECDELLTAPTSLPADALTNECYDFMFRGCVKLEKAPDLLATVLAWHCYTNMFDGCSQLNYIKLSYIGDFLSDNFSDWVKNVPASGDFYYNGIYTYSFGQSRIPQSSSNQWTIHRFTKPLKFKALQNFATLTYHINGNLSPAPDVEYSYDNVEWETWTKDFGINLQQGDIVYVRNKNNTLSQSESNYFYFTMVKDFDVTGDINCMINGANLTDYCFYKLFYNCGGLNEAPELLATTLADNCYKSMFEGCSFMKIAPELPATTLRNNCYTNMFKNCKALVEPPVELPALSLVESCYDSMFAGCVNLKEGPELLALTLANGCYKNMFSGCIKLSKLDISYMGAFDTSYFENWVDGVANTGTIYYKGSDTSNYGSSAIPKDSSNRWNIEEKTYLILTSEQDGSTIKYLTLVGAGDSYIDVWYSTDAINWTKWNVNSDTLTLANGESIYVWRKDYKYRDDYGAMVFEMTGKIAASGNIESMNRHKPLTEYCFYCLFDRCEALTKAPDLPYTELKSNCYDNMFNRCSNLIDGPRIRATTLANNCFESMFAQCNNLTSVTLDYTGAYDTNAFKSKSGYYWWFKDTTSTNPGVLYYNGTDTATFLSEGLPDGWSIQTFTP